MKSKWEISRDEIRRAGFSLSSVVNDSQWDEAYRDYTKIEPKSIVATHRLFTDGSAEFKRHDLNERFKQK